MKASDLEVGARFCKHTTVYWKGTADQLPAEVREDWKHSPVLDDLVEDRVDMVVLKSNTPQHSTLVGHSGNIRQTNWYSWVRADADPSDY